MDNGCVTIQERNIHSSGEDWKIQSLTFTTTTSTSSSSASSSSDDKRDNNNNNTNNTNTNTNQQIDKKLRKLLYNAPKPISIIEKAIESCEEKIAE